MASAQRRLARVAGELNSSLDTAVWAVQPDKDTLLNLIDYLGDTFHALLAGSGMELDLDFPDSVPPWPLTRSERYHLALAAIEALNNALKHSKSTILRVSLTTDSHAFTLRIADNGIGLRADSAGPSINERVGRTGHTGDGLVNMRERVERLGGEFRISSPAGNGTVVEMSLSPMARRTSDNAMPSGGHV